MVEVVERVVICGRKKERSRAKYFLQANTMGI